MRKLKFAVILAFAILLNFSFSIGFVKAPGTSMPVSVSPLELTLDNGDSQNVFLDIENKNIICSFDCEYFRDCQSQGTTGSIYAVQKKEEL